MQHSIHASLQLEDGAHVQSTRAARPSRIGRVVLDHHTSRRGLVRWRLKNGSAGLSRATSPPKRTPIGVEGSWQVLDATGSAQVTALIIFKAKPARCWDY